MNEADWIKHSMFGEDGQLPTGPIGLTYKALGTIPFAIKGAWDGDFAKNK